MTEETGRQKRQLDRREGTSLIDLIIYVEIVVDVHEIEILIMKLMLSIVSDDMISE